MTVESHGIKAIGYDVDGTMVDSEPLHVAAWHETLALHNRRFEDLDTTFQATMAGRKPLAIATFMVESLRIPATPEAFLGQKHASFMDKVRTDLRPMPGVVESVRRLSGNYALGIGTSLTREYVDLVLGGLGVASEFSVIVTGDEITHGKPDPETYQVLARRMQVEPHEMAVLEDATSGILSAKAAGCWCVAVENRDAVQQDTSQADVVVYSLNEVTEGLLGSLAS